jgi:hypothetical protein
MSVARLNGIHAFREHLRQRRLVAAAGTFQQAGIRTDTLRGSSFPVERNGDWLRSIVQGYFNYHAVQPIAVIISSSVVPPLRLIAAFNREIRP